tara:strand:- start:93 stop:1709 length:1617 start_codon:yes stop_codon:yes gene_type:complete
VVSASIVDGSIVNADVNASAAIAGTKISPDFGSQNIVTTGNGSIGGTNLNMLTAYIDFSGSISTPSTAAAIYRPADNSLAVSTGNSQRLLINNSGASLTGNLDVSSGLDVSGANLTVDAQIVSTGSILVDDGTNARITITKNSATNARILATTTGFAAYTNLEIRSSTVNFKNSGDTQTLTLTAAGQLLVGATASRSPLGVSSKLQVEGLDSSSAISISRNSANQHGGYFLFNKSRGAALGSDTIVQDDDALGSIYWCGNDGNDSDHAAAFIAADVDAAPGSDEIPGRLRFGTTSDGANSATERMRIDSSGNTHFGSSGTLNNSNTVSIIPADGRISFGMDGRTSFVTGESGSYIYSGEGSSGTTLAGDLILQSRSNGDRTIRFITGSSPAQRVSITNNGLLFGTDTAADNALDDYEEGNWTPDIFNAGSTSNWTAKDGNYQKIGNTVTVWFRCDGGTSPRSGASGGHLTITGLPFTINGMDANTVLGTAAANFVSSGSEDCNISTAGSGNPFVRQGGSNESEQCNYFSAVFTYLTTQ